MAWIMEAINEYLRSCCVIVRAPLAYIIRKTIIVQTYCNYHKCATPDEEMIARMLHLPLDMKKLHNGKTEVSMTSSIRSARTLIGIHV